MLLVGKNIATTPLRRGVLALIGVWMSCAAGSDQAPRQGSASIEIGAGRLTVEARLLREDTDPAVRSRAAAALGEIGDPAVVSALRIGASDSEQIVRVRAVRALAAVKDDQSTQVLADVLFSHPDTRTRLLAVWALRQHDSPLARSYLEASGADGNKLVRQAVARPRHPEAAKQATDAAEAQDGASTETPPAETEGGTDGTDTLSGAGTVTQ